MELKIKLENKIENIVGADKCPSSSTPFFQDLTFRRKKSGPRFIGECGNRRSVVLTPRVSRCTRCRAIYFRLPSEFRQRVLRHC